MSLILTVMRKEWRDLMRDRRTVLIGLAMGALLAPALIIGMNAYAAEKRTKQMESVLKLPVVGTEWAPNLVTWLEQRNVEVVDAPAEISSAINEQEHEVILEITPDYQEHWYLQQNARVNVYYDSSRESARVARARVDGLLNQYSSQMGRLRMLSRGVDPGSASALLIVRNDLATEASRAGQALLFLPYFLILTAFLGGAYFVIDVTAGERERESLESLLLVPAPAWQIMLGKVMACLGFGLMMISVALLAFKLSFSFAPNLIVEMKLSWMATGGIALSLIPIALIGVALLTLLAANAKTVKEAQSYMSVLTLLPIIPTFALMINPVKTQLWMYAVPFVSQNQLIMAILRGEAVGWSELVVYASSQLAIATLILSLAAWRYSSERMALGR